MLRKGCTRGHATEIQRTEGSIEERDTIEHHTAGEGGCEDILRSSLCTVMTVFVERHQTGHGHGCHLESEEEHQEMSCTYHHVHTQQGRYHEHVELTFLERGIGSTQPLTGLNHHDQCSCSQDGLDDMSGRNGAIHTTESLNGIGLQERYNHLSEHQQTHQRIEPLPFSMLRRDEICDERHHQDSHQCGFRYHIEKLSVVHITFLLLLRYS